MKKFNEICEVEKADGTKYKIKSNLVDVAASKTNNEENNKWIMAYGKNLDMIQIIDVDELKAWYCDNFVSMAETKRASKQLHSCDALYISPKATKEHYLIEFKNQSRLEFGDSALCENINMKAFDSRQMLYDVFGKRFSPDKVKEKVKLYIVYSYEQSAKENDQKVIDLRNRIRKTSKSKNISRQEQKQTSKEKAEGNIEKVMKQQQEFFQDVQFMNAEMFIASFVEMAKNAPCSMG